MTSRFRIIDGGGKLCSKDVVVLPTGRTETWETYHCGECSDELGFKFSQLHEVRIGTIVTSGRGSAGKVIGGQRWLACPRCHQLRFQLSDPANNQSTD